MINEIIFLILAFIDLCFALLALKLGGRSGLASYITANLILIGIFGGKLILLFGKTSNVSNVFYASAFLAMNILLEHYRKNESIKVIWIGSSMLVLCSLLSAFAIRTEFSSSESSLSDALTIIFKLNPRLVLASLIAYVVSQHLNVYIFYKLRDYYGHKKLWLRSLTSTVISQVVDSILFFGIAFYALLTLDLMFESAIASLLLKFIVAFMSIPFLYLSYIVLEKKINNEN